MLGPLAQTVSMFGLSGGPCNCNLWALSRYGLLIGWTTAVVVYNVDKRARDVSLDTMPATELLEIRLRKTGRPAARI